ncbi:MAG: hypothetical protein AB4063_22045 [Crocosphaera sp.]
MNSSAYIAFWPLPPIIITTIFAILFIFLIAPNNEQISFLGITFTIPQMGIVERVRKSYYYAVIIFLIIISVLLFLPITAFSCETKIAEIPDKKGKITDANIRTYPAQKSKIIKTIGDEKKINVINIKSGWVKINKLFDENNKSEDIKGFIAANRTKVALDCPRLLRKLPNDFNLK